MTARARPMGLDSGTSIEAAVAASPTIRAHVQATIVTLLKEYGPLTDEEIVERYLARAGSHPFVPLVTPQRIRTARHALVLDGQVHDTQALGFSRLGHRATVWGLT